MAVAAALMCAAASLSSVAPHEATATRVAAVSVPSAPARVCTSARCAPGQAPGATAPLVLQLALGAVVVAGVAVSAVVRRRKRMEREHIPFGFPSTHFRPPIFA